MIYYLDQSEVPDLENIPPQVLTWLVRKAEAAQGRYDKLWRYYLGQHDVFRRQRREEEVPVAVNYAKYVVDTIQGYYLGQPVKYDANRLDRGGRPVNIKPLLACYDWMQAGELDAAIGTNALTEEETAWARLLRYYLANPNDGDYSDYPKTPEDLPA